MNPFDKVLITLWSLGIVLCVVTTNDITFRTPFILGVLPGLFVGYLWGKNKKK